MTAMTSWPCVHFTPTKQSTHDNICKINEISILDNHNKNSIALTVMSTIETCKTLLNKMPAEIRNMCFDFQSNIYKVWTNPFGDRAENDTLQKMR